MHEATKNTEKIEGYVYQVRRMTPVVGGYIWQRFMHAMWKARQEAKVEETYVEETPEEKKLPLDVRVRGLCGVALMQLSFEDFNFVQREALRMVSRLVDGLPIPITSDDGRWAFKEVAEEPMTVTKLVMEVLAFNLSGFLA
jgi:hypothetical protein